MFVTKSAFSKLKQQYDELFFNFNNLSEAYHYEKGNKRFTSKEIKTLISLCHPDKHNGKNSAVEMTQKLLNMRG